MATGQEPTLLSPRKDWFTLQSPIAVIGAFTAIVEVALIVSSIFVQDHARWALIIFAFLAFFFVAGQFFWILKNKNWVLYPPKEYGGETGVITYVGAMTQSVSANPATQLPVGNEDGIAEVMTSSTLQRKITYEVSEPAQVVEERVVVSEAQQSLLVFMAPKSSSSLGLPVDYGMNMTVLDCLIYIGNRLLPEFASDDTTEKQHRHYMNYGTTWALRESATQQVFSNLGPQWAWQQSGNMLDRRLLRDTDLKPGMHIELTRFVDQSFPVSELQSAEAKLLREENKA